MDTSGLDGPRLLRDDDVEPLAGGRPRPDEDPRDDDEPFPDPGARPDVERAPEPGPRADVELRPDTFLPLWLRPLLCDGALLPALCEPRPPEFMLYR